MTRIKAPFTGIVSGEIDIDLPDLPTTPPVEPPEPPVEPPEPPVEPPEPVPPPTDGETNLSAIWLSEDFQGVPLLANPKDHTVISDCSNARCVSMQNMPGGLSKAIVSTVTEGGNEYGGGDFGGWGYIYRSGFPRMGAGSKLWVRKLFYIPDDFSWMNGKHCKYIRIHKVRSDGGNDGYMDTYINGSGQNYLKSITEMGAGHPTPPWYTTTESLPKGEWFFFESYYEFNGTLPGVRAFWINGELKDAYSVGHSQRSGVEMDQLNVFTYWDSYLPKQQSLAFAHLAVAVKGNVEGHGWVDNTGDMASDEHGNKFIGITL